jgi:hypothetical protein
MTFTEEQLAELNKIVGASIASTFAADSPVMKTIAANNAAQLKAQLGGLDIAGQITTAMEALKPKGDDAEAARIAAAEAARIAAGGDPNPTPAMLKMQAQLAKITQEAKDATQRAESEAASRKMDRLHQAFREAAGKAGVPADRVAAMLNHANGLGIVKYDDKERPGLAFQKQWGEEVMAMGSEDMGAMKAFLDTPDGKIFLPPRGLNGTGEGGGRDGRGGPTDTTDFVLEDGTLNERAMGNAIMNKLSQLGNQ